MGPLDIDRRPVFIGGDGLLGSVAEGFGTLGVARVDDKGIRTLLRRESSHGREVLRDRHIA
ncbi:Uncharacterised protein [Mycobacteroides abscessus subsp. abscessus]|nr:Uncharacterised protein [Mycobacteroides abscessus subsp. abscessus]